MSKQHLYLGKSGEEAAVSFLKKNGYKILVRNYKTRLGEIDIIGTDKDTFCFIEVKTRNSLRFGSPSEAISRIKQRHVANVALQFIKENNLLDKKARFDVVSVVFSGNGPQLDLIKNAFEIDTSFIY